MLSETPSPSNLLVIELTTAEMESLDAGSLNDRIRQSISAAVLLCQQGQSPSIPTEKALSRFRIGSRIKMIVPSENTLPLLFTRSAWQELGGFQGGLQPAQEIVKEFLDNARKARLFTIIQIHQ
jgi:hypothetical protein